MTCLRYSSKQFFITQLFLFLEIFVLNDKNEIENDQIMKCIQDIWIFGSVL